jgi:hypothetical protein
VEHRGVRAARDDRVEGQEVRAAAQERRFEHDLHLPLRRSGDEQRCDRREAGSGRPLRHAHPAQLDGVLLAADAD